MSTTVLLLQKLSYRICNVRLTRQNYLNNKKYSKKTSWYDYKSLRYQRRHCIHIRAISWMTWHKWKHLWRFLPPPAASIFFFFFFWLANVMTCRSKNLQMRRLGESQSNRTNIVVQAQEYLWFWRLPVSFIQYTLNFLSKMATNTQFIEIIDHTKASMYIYWTDSWNWKVDRH